jgi:hypothetical protein
MSQTSVSPAGESFPLPQAGDYAREFERIESLARAARAEGREIVVVMGVGFVGAVMAAIVADSVDPATGKPGKFVIGCQRPSSRSYWKIPLLTRGESPVKAEDPEVEPMIARVVRDKKTLTATYNGVSGTATLTVTPQPPPASLSSITLSPTTVVGGASSQGTVTLTSGAPAGGAVLALASSQTSVANVPASVTVNAGASSANFTVTSSAVTSSTTVTVTATYNSVPRTATLTINPATAGPLPAPPLVSPSHDARFQFGQQITFDWSDVTGATGYTIQIDDRDNFPAPLILSQTTTGSSFSSSSLARADMWWRVRANDAAGNPGAWSGARRFRVE